MPSLDEQIEIHLFNMEEQRRGWPSYRKGRNIFYTQDVKTLRELRRLKRQGKTS